MHDLKRALVIVVICTCGILSGLRSFQHSPGIDFYQFWGVGMANRLSDGSLSNPYVQLEQYDATLGSYVGKAGDARLQEAYMVNHEINPYGLDVNCTPLFYALFAVASADYTYGFGLFSVIQTILLTGTVLVLIYSLHLKDYVVLGILPILLYFYEPLRADAVAGNINVFQLCSIVAFASFLELRREKKRTENALVPGALFLCAVVLFTLIKPNFILVSLALTASLYVIEGSRHFNRAAIVAALFGAVLWAIPCLYFGSWTIWMDWFHYLSIGSGKLSYGIWQWNFSLSRLSWEVFHLPIVNTFVILALLLGGSLLVVLSKAGNTGRAAAGLLGNPHVSATIAITATLALSPLVWYHYYLLSLLPVLWLLSAAAKCRVCGSLALLSLVLSSDLIPILLRDYYYLPYVVACSWLPLWAGVLMAIRRLCDENAPVADEARL